MLCLRSDAAPLPGAEEPAFPEFERKDTRRRTFSAWPKGAGAAADSLAEAGFVYTGGTRIVLRLVMVRKEAEAVDLVSNL